jgi:simple sugar transport system permease protein
MLFGAFFSVVASYYFESAAAGILAGALTGLAVGMLFGVFVLYFKTDEFIVGIAINILAIGATTFLMRAWFEVKASFSSPQIQPLPEVALPGLPADSVLGVLFSHHTVLTYLSWILVPLLYVLFYHTRFGLHLRATGEHPEALEAAGGRVVLMRYVASAACGTLCGLAGTHLALGYLSQFVQNMTAGRGFIALAALLFGDGNPVRILGASFIFGLAESLSIRLQGFGIPPYFALMTPYIVTIVALIIVSARRRRAQIAG